MKKYLAVSLLILASVSFAAGNSVKLGQKDHNSDPDPCNKPEILGCGPCHKACIQQNNNEGITEADPGSPKSATTSSKGTGKATAK